MSLREKKIGDSFNKTSLVVLAVVVLITSTYALDLLFHLGWGYKISDLKVGLGILLFAIILRLVGLRVIRVFESKY